MEVPPRTIEMQKCGEDLFFNSKAFASNDQSKAQSPMVCIHYKAVQLYIFLKGNDKYQKGRLKCTADA